MEENGKGFWEENRHTLKINDGISGVFGCNV